MGTASGQAVAAAEVWNWMALEQGKDEDEEEDEGAFWLVEGRANGFIECRGVIHMYSPVSMLQKIWPNRTCVTLLNIVDKNELILGTLNNS